MMRRLTLLLLCAIFALATTACNRSEKPKPPQAGLNAAGATFPYPMYSKWFSEYHKLHPDVQVNYQSIGSGGGIRQRASCSGRSSARPWMNRFSQMAKAPEQRLVERPSWFYTGGDSRHTLMPRGFLMVMAGST